MAWEENAIKDLKAFADIAIPLNSRGSDLEKTFLFADIMVTVPSSFHTGAFVAGAFAGAICLERSATGRSSR